MRARHTLFLVVAVLTATPAFPNDFVEACETFAHAEVVFVGRVGQPVKRHLSGEAEFAPAREAVERAQAEITKFQSSPEYKTMDSLERQKTDHDLAVKWMRADEVLDNLIAWYPEPMDVLLFPVQIETVFRGVTIAEVFLVAADSSFVDPGRSYLIYGRGLEYGNVLKKGAPPLVVMSSGEPRLIEDAGEHLRFLNLAGSGAYGTTIYGKLMLGSSGQTTARPMAGVTIRFASDAGLLDAITQKDGTFMRPGVPAGRVEVSADLPPGLTVGGPIVHEVQSGGCIEDNMTAVPDGRVSGTLIGERDTVRFMDVQLRGIGHDRSYQTSVNEVGVFEFRGVAPGRYRLFSVPVVSPPPSRACPHVVPTYYPGTMQEEDAAPVVVDVASPQIGLNFPLVCTN